MDKLVQINDAVNSFAWGWFGLVLLLGTGLICSVITKCFQITHLPHWWRKTIGSVFKKDAHKKNEVGAVSQFQALCTALAATIGTGNIAGVAAAICVGGPGAVFWMWIAAILGMMTNFSENILGIYYRRRNAENEWSGGAMYYLQDGLGSYKGMKTVGKVLAVIFSVFAILASFGIGNMGQINKITLNIESAFFSNVNAPEFLGASLVNWIIGIALTIVGGFIILGGLKRIAAFAEKVVPFMALVYILGALIIIITHITMVGSVFAAIFKFAFGIKAVEGAILGVVVKEVIKAGCKRGVFSNEAGLGSSVMVHSNSTVKEPVKQGLWGIFEVFADTIVVCTMTAIVVLTSGAFDLDTGRMTTKAYKTTDKVAIVLNEDGTSSITSSTNDNIVVSLDGTKLAVSKVDNDKKIIEDVRFEIRDANNEIAEEWYSSSEAKTIDTLKAGEYTIEEKSIDDATLVARSFGSVFGKPGEWFVALAVLLFAFTTVMGWSHYGSKSVEYLAGVKGAKVYRIIFVIMIISGAIMKSSLAWDISDTFNGLMMIPNLIGVLSLTPIVVKLTQNYVDRKIKGKKDVTPMLSFFKEINDEHAKYIEETGED
ncbi:MAG: alanine:cation symporter family protein [Clostridia bacterium]|nr:alanine:cation symporter family protein [Clostridia bacterium]